ncbi:TfpX/TfpZ family type IV pilin accessory protein [Psychrobacter sp. AOP7-B1-24]|uniref:TfpX/TfpZ family type IV pilin accessory protein n=1 Tax=Psychrobacter sp. AOP7-B1-24 TaxID=3457645 RepID=UPI00402B2FC2
MSTTSKPSSKLEITGYHVLCSLVLNVLISAIIYFVWYPSHLYQATGVLPAVLMMIALNLIVAPLLTFIVYKADKKELTRDIAVIAVLQIAALGYGLYIVEAGRPAYIAFAVDNFEVVRGFDNEWAQQHLGTQMTAAKPLGLFEKPKFVYSVLASEPKIKAEELTLEEFAVKEYQMRVPAIFRTDSYQPIETAADIIQTKAKPLSKLTNSNDKLRVEAVLRHYPDSEGWLPLTAPVVNMVVLIDKDGNVIDIVDLRPHYTSRLSEVL